MNRTLPRLALLTLLLARGALAAGAEPPASKLVTFRDKTLVAWVRLDDPAQRGVSALSVENLPGEFDAIVLGELAQGKWMAGSDGFRRTHRDQDAWPAETSPAGSPVQVAIVYEGRDVSIYRDGRPYAHYRMDVEPATFSNRSVVLLGLRHREISGPTLRGAIDDARIYDHALDAATIVRLVPDRITPDEVQPLAWWDFEDGTTRDQMNTFAAGFVVGKARVANGALVLDGGHLVAGVEPPPTRAQESWPVYHISARPSEGLCRPYDANGCIFWKGQYHLMYIYQDPSLPQGGHCWGHMVSTDLVNWKYLPPALRPLPGDADVGTFSGNAFINKEGVPMLCWFGIGAGVCVATAQDDNLIRWKKHPKNPIIPMPRPGTPEASLYRVWDPYLWLEGDHYICLLGGNTLPDGKDTLYAHTSPDLVNWTARHPFYEHPDKTWTGPGEDCSCPDFFKLGDRHALLCISHKVGGRIYVGRFDAQAVKFTPERHFRMNWPGGQFFAPESLLDGKGRRIVWAWVTDPRTITTQQATGSGVQSLPRVIGLDAEGALRITPPDELRSLRKSRIKADPVTIPADQTVVAAGIHGDTLELAAEIEPGQAKAVGLSLRRAADASEETVLWYDAAAGKLVLAMDHSTRRKDVVYTEGPLDTGGITTGSSYPNPRKTVEAPFALKPGEPLRLHVFLDGPMLEVFANDRQCLTQQVFPSRKDSLGIAFVTKGAPARVRSLEAWELKPARFDR